MPEDGALREEYERGWKITEVMPVNGWGVATRKDYLVVDFDRATIVERFKQIQRSEPQEAIVQFGIKQSPHWSFIEVHENIVQDDVESAVVPMLFRPFDVRYTFYRKYMIERGDHRAELMANFQEGTVGLITVRRVEDSISTCHAFATVLPSVLHSTSAKEGNFVFPLWLYPSASDDLLGSATKEKTANLAPEFVAALTQAVGATPSPEDTLAYIYAILYAPSYRARYADFLKRDFPRVPLTTNRKLFEALVEVGRELIALHTMQTTLPRITGFPVPGSNEVVKVRFLLPSPSGRGVGGEGTISARGAMEPEPSPAPSGHPLPEGEGNGISKLASEGEGSKSGRVWINDAQYFEGVPESVWDMHIGGYRVAEKWLKDRKGRLLTFDDIEHYQRVIAALTRTLALQAELDASVTWAGGWPLR